VSGNGEIYLNRFQRSQREIELPFIELSAVHLTILPNLRGYHEFSAGSERIAGLTPSRSIKHFRESL
jgi:hypothetical protein